MTILRTALFVLLCGFSFGTAVADPGLPTVKPEKVGLSSERLERMTTHFQRYVDEGKLAGLTVAIARKGKLAYLKTMGWADIEAKRPVTPDTIFRIFSMTKPVIAVAVMSLVEEGRLGLDDPVSEYLPAFTNSKVYEGEETDGPRLEAQETPITVYHLLTHTSGLTYRTFSPGYVGDQYSDRDIGDPARSLAEMAEVAAALPLSVQPGTVYQYGISYDILCRIIEIVTGRTLSDFLQQRLFDPLRMSDTHFIVPANKRERLAEIYEVSKTGKPVLHSNERTRTAFQESANLQSEFHGLVTTVGDYLRLSQMLLNGGHLDGTRILSRKTVELMTTSQLAYDQLAFIRRFTPGYGIGLGFGVLDDVAASQTLGSRGEYFWMGSANTYFFVDPEEDIAAVLFSQFEPVLTYPLRDELKTLTYQAIID